MIEYNSSFHNIYAMSCEYDEDILTLIIILCIIIHPILLFILDWTDPLRFLTDIFLYDDLMIWENELYTSLYIWNTNWISFHGLVEVFLFDVKT